MTLLTQISCKPEISLELLAEPLEERGTIVHCRLTMACLLRISPLTFLIQDDWQCRPLVSAYEIVQAPEWDFAAPDHRFTLVFEGLDSGCQHFDLLEDTKEPYPFHFTGISRNKTDVYHLEYPNFSLE